jgi:hypothetical protein
MSQFRFLITFVLAATLFLGLAQAQQIDPLLSLSTSTKSVTLGPDQAATIEWNVANGGTADGTVSLRLNTVKGWKLDLASSDQSFTLPGGQSRAIKVMVRPVPASGPQNDTLTLTGAIQSAAANRGNSQTSSVALAYIAPAALPPPPPPDHTLAWVLAIGVAVVLIAAAAYVAQARQVRLVVSTQQKEVNVGTDGIYEVQVRNGSRSMRNVELRIGTLPTHWFAAFSFPTVQVAGRETALVPVYVKVPSDAQAQQQVSVPIYARPNRFSPWLARGHFTVQVVELSAGLEGRNEQFARPVA